MTLLLSKKDEVIEFNSHRLYKSKDRNYMYSVLNNTIFEIDQLVLEILKLSGKTTQEVISSLQTDFSKKQIEEVLISMEKGLVIKSEDNDRKIQKLTNHLNINPIISLTLLIVQECNLGCTYCYAEDGEYLDKGKMNNDIAKASIDFLLENSGDRKDIYVVFFGGEPLLNFDLIQSTVKYAKEKEKEFGKTIRYSITTNGTLITNKIRNFFKENEFTVQISMDGSEEVHNANRYYKGGKGSYEIILNRTKEMREENFITARSTITPKGLNVSEMFDHLANLGFRSVAMSPAAYMLSDDDYKTLNKEMVQLVETFKEYLKVKDYKKVFQLSNVRSMLDRLHSGGYRSHFCGAGANSFAIDIRGNLYPCHRFVSEKNYILGNVVQGKKVERHENFMEESHVKNRTTCTTCWARNLCTGGCHHENLQATGKIQSPPANYCKMTQNFINEIIKLYLNLSEEEKKLLF